MAGHSKWANIKHRKGAQDAKRAKIFARFSKEIMVAAAKGGPDPSSNSSLRLAITKAKAQSMPKKNIEAAIAKATGGGDAANYQEISYGGNVNGVSFLVFYLADNPNRVAANVQASFRKVNGSVTGASSVSYVFDRKAIFEFSKEGRDEEETMMLSIEAGAEDFETSDESFFVYADPSNFTKVKEGLEAAGISEFKTAEVSYIPNNEVKVDKAKAEKILNFIDTLEDDEDIQNVYHNLDASSLD